MIHNSMSKSHRRDSTMAILLFSIVIVFLCCHTARLVLNVYEAVQVGRWIIRHLLSKLVKLMIYKFQMVHYGTIQFWPAWADNLTRLNHLMLVVNSSVNILIYTAKVGRIKSCIVIFTSMHKVTVTVVYIALLPYSFCFTLLYILQSCDIFLISGFQVSPSFVCIV